MTIPISKDGGLEPHLTYCPRCGGEGTGLTVGVLYKTQTPNGWLYYQRGERSKALKNAGLTISDTLDNGIHVEDGEKVPDNDICETCKEEIATFEAEVAKGGVHFRCEECHREGVIKAGTEFADAVRESSGIKAPDPVGVKFEHCTEHGGDGA